MLKATIIGAAFLFFVGVVSVVYGQTATPTSTPTPTTNTTVTPTPTTTNVGGTTVPGGAPATGFGR